MCEGSVPVVKCAVGVMDGFKVQGDYIKDWV